MLAQQFDEAFHQKYNQKNVRAYKDMYDDALRLMKSEDLKAFDLGMEPQRRPRRLREQRLRPGLPARPPARRERRALRRSHPRRLGHALEQLHLGRAPRREPRPGARHAADRPRAPRAARRNGRRARHRVRPHAAHQRRRRPRPLPEGVLRVCSPAAAFEAVTFTARPMRARRERRSKGRSPRRTSTPPSPTPSGLPLDQIVYSPSKRPFKVADNGQPIMDLFA